MDQNQLHQMPQMMENFDQSNQQMEKDLDRMLELFKELELEQKLNQTIQGLQELGENSKSSRKKLKCGRKG